MGSLYWIIAELLLWAWLPAGTWLVNVISCSSTRSPRFSPFTLMLRTSDGITDPYGFPFFNNWKPCTKQPSTHVIRSTIVLEKISNILNIVGSFWVISIRLSTDHKFLSRTRLLHTKHSPLLATRQDVWNVFTTPQHGMPSSWQHQNGRSALVCVIATHLH